MSNTAEMAMELIKQMIAAGQVPDPEKLPALIESVGASLNRLGEAGAQQPSAEPRRPMTAMEMGQQPAVPIRESVQPDYIVCLEDGKKMKMLKRHLSTAFNMTPEEYIAKWGLPPTYPMVAPNYAKQKSKYARYKGLGTHRMREEVAAKRAKAEQD